LLSGSHVGDKEGEAKKVILTFVPRFDSPRYTEWRAKLYGSGAARRPAYGKPSPNLKSRVHWSRPRPHIPTPFNAITSTRPHHPRIRSV